MILRQKDQEDKLNKLLEACTNKLERKQQNADNLKILQQSQNTTPAQQ